MTDKFDSKTRSRIMSTIRSKNTKIELNFKKLLQKNKLVGYKSHYGITGKPDIVYISKRIAIFIDGDFWHGYNWKVLGKVPPKIYWQNKIKRNMMRDKKYTGNLQKLGWKVIRFWEHDILNNPEKCIEKIKKAY